MNAECEIYLTSLKALHSGLEKAVAGLGVAALDKVPVAGANSLTVLLSHALGAERFLIVQLVGGTDIHRNRDAEFAASGQTDEALMKLIRTTEREAESVLKRLGDGELGELRQHREGPRPVRWCILHAIEHVAEHLGHAGLTRQLIDAGMI